MMWYGGPGFGGWGGYGLGWGGGWLMMIIGILGFLFVLWGIIMILRWSTMGTHRPYRTYRSHYYRNNYDDAVSALKMRYARGEITKEEYERILRDLMNN
ncbi:SHOCT domain-containing protein [Athalassotoga sp.]|uniref:SHOCT domain-containing protein n=2 Tax=Athalassotoga sp. TaxID=2022597 RepID=UPI003CFC9D5F